MAKPAAMGGTTTSTPTASKADEGEAIQVCVRVRPLMYHEQGTEVCCQVVKDMYADNPCTITIGHNDTKPQQFTFDEAFSSATTQKQIFERRVVPLIDRCLEGFNSTVIAYGQTGAGKTHTIMGPAMEMDEESSGVIPRAVTKIFQDLDAADQDYEVRVQFLEIYGEDIRDLLAVGRAEKLTIRDAGVAEPEVLGAAQHKVESAEEALSTLSRGMMQRVTASTEMNASSSRSHAIMTLIIEQNAGDDLENKRSKFAFVDLAGAERQKRTKATGQRMKEGVDINKGLLVLGNVISALGDPKKKNSFVPYRDSKLTRLLKGSLGGNHKSLMIACVSPSDRNLAESLNCLRYANRAKNIKNKTVQNVDPKAKYMADLKNQLKMLAVDLLKARNGDTLGAMFPNDLLQALAKGLDVKTPTEPVEVADPAAEITSKPDSLSESLTGEEETADASESSAECPEGATKAIIAIKPEKTAPASSTPPGDSTIETPAQTEEEDDGPTLEEELLGVRERLADLEEREMIMLEQTTAHLEEINRLQFLLMEEKNKALEAASKDNVENCVPVDTSGSIPLDEDSDRSNDSDKSHQSFASTASQGIMSATTDVCGCVFLTLSTPDGMKLVKDMEHCTKGHGPGRQRTARRHSMSSAMSSPAPKQAETATEKPAGNWFQRWRNARPLSPVKEKSEVSR